MPKKQQSKKQIKNLKQHNKNQRAKRVARRQKECLWCKNTFQDTSFRLSQKTCSRSCALALGVSTRKQCGSYKRTKEQNKKMIDTFKKLRLEGKAVISKEKRNKLSKLLKDRWENGEMKEAVRKTSIEKYGVEHPMQAEIVKQNLRNSFTKKYGIDWATKSSIVKEKTRNTRIERGLTYQFGNKTMLEWADELEISYSYFKQVTNEQGIETAKKLSLNKTGIESTVNKLISEIYDGEILYDVTKFKTYRPDFILPHKNIIIECDGLAWHCDRVNKDKKYHFKKKEFYKENGYKTFFFRSDEIVNKEIIVKSIIGNALLANTCKLFARKLIVKEETKKSTIKDFYQDNHLMGPGAGRVYGLYNNDKLVAAIQVKWKNKKTKVLEISRFCTLANTSVVGGYSRLISKVIKTEKPSQIITFVDERYGNGNYLLKLGFIKKKTSVSFRWTDGKRTYHRLKFRGNSGYSQGLYKIWDCGQTLFSREINDK